MDEKAWGAILTGWTPLTVIINGVSTSKSRKTWIKAENSLANINFKALHAIFASVEVN